MLWNGCWETRWDDEIKKIFFIYNNFSFYIIIYNLFNGENRSFYGKDYILKNFKYSILEIFDTKTGQEYILERENYWKNIFETKKFGMNKN